MSLAPTSIEAARYYNSALLPLLEMSKTRLMQLLRSSPVLYLAVASPFLLALQRESASQNSPPSCHPFQASQQVLKGVKIANNGALPPHEAAVQLAAKSTTA